MNFLRAWIHAALLAVTLSACGGGGGSAGDGSATIAVGAAASTSSGTVVTTGTAQAGAFSGSVAGFYVAVLLDTNASSATRSSLNNKGHVAFTSLGQARFYDGASVRILDTLAAESAAAAVNEEDQVTGFSTAGSLGTAIQRAVVWTNGATRDLGAPAGLASVGLAINAQGHVAGTSGAGGAAFAFLWTPQAGVVDLGASAGLPGLAFSSAALINATDAVVGQASTPAAPGETVAFLWTPASGIRSLGTLGGLSSLAQDLNDASQVVGKAAMADRRVHAFLWTAQAGMLDLDTLGGANSNALAINQMGQIAGESETADGSSHAFVWGPAGSAFSSMIDLGSFGGTSRAVDINDAGQVVGTAQTSDGSHRAFMWTVVDGMVDLNSRLAIAQTGLVLQDAVAISNDGSVLVQSNQGLVLLKPAASGLITGNIEFVQTGLVPVTEAAVRGTIDLGRAPQPAVPTAGITPPDITSMGTSSIAIVSTGMAPLVPAAAGVVLQVP